MSEPVLPTEYAVVGVLLRHRGPPLSDAEIAEAIRSGAAVAVAVTYLMDAQIDNESSMEAVGRSHGRVFAREIRNRAARPAAMENA